MTSSHPRHSAPRSALTAALIGLMLVLLPTATLAVQEDTTPTTRTCAEVQATPDIGMPGMPHGAMHGGSPVAGMPHMDGMPHGTPIAGMEQVEFDLMYIDMMIPHHESVIALAEVARGELTHPSLIAMAEEIIGTQDAEIEAMRELRAAWYPGAPTVGMGMMMDAMPGMGTDMAHMDEQMNAESQVQAFCAAENKDLAFIQQVIPHHRMAIEVSEYALELAVHPELVASAELVIEAQEQEIEELVEIRTEISGGATPAD